MPLIGNIDPLNRRHGDIDFLLPTCLQPRLQKIVKAGSTNCIFCNRVMTTSITFFLLWKVGRDVCSHMEALFKIDAQM